MIVVQLKGGLGNQMFQYATARRLAQKHKTRLGLDLSWFDMADLMDAPRNYELDCFEFEPNFVKRDKDFILAADDSGIKPKIYKFTKGILRPRLRPYVEKNQQFDKAVLGLPNNSYLDGFWQTEKYFSDIRETLLSDFTFKTEATGKNLATLKEIKSTNSVSVHVRRLDYVSNKATSKIHGFTGLEYYKTAVSKISQKVDNPHFFVFSDEPDWCKKNLKIDFPTTYISGNEKGFEDMRLMHYCQHNVIANSSFSWWGAWLNNNSDKITIAPKKWFNDSMVSAKDITPTDWIRL